MLFKRTIVLRIRLTVDGLQRVSNTLKKKILYKKFQF